MTNKKLIALLISASVTVPGLASAAKVAGDALEIYGKAHISLDRVSGSTTTGDVTNWNVSSNSSRLGFTGQAPMGPSIGFYKIESSISMDNSGGAIDKRAAYAGLKGSFGSLLAGYRDTPFKDIRGMFDLFGDTIGDARNILGSVSDGTNVFDQRAKNALMYTAPTSQGFIANIMYSTAWEGDVSGQAGQDNNNNNLLSVNIVYQSRMLVMVYGREKQKHVNATTGSTNEVGTGTRFLLTYGMEPMRFGLIYEKLDDDTDATRRRSAYGVNFSSQTGQNTAKFQYLKSSHNDIAGNTGATEIALGYDFALTKSSSTYIMYTKVKNDGGAAYLMGNGHDQVYTSDIGKNISAFSMGYILSF